MEYWKTRYNCESSAASTSRIWLAGESGQTGSHPMTGSLPSGSTVTAEAGESMAKVTAARDEATGLLAATSGLKNVSLPEKRLFSVKVVNPKNSGGHCVESWHAGQFLSVEEMETKLGEEFADLIQGNIFQFGYIVPGHGMKGKQKTVESLEDLSAMWNEYKGKRCVLLWIKCQKSQPSKRLRSTSTDTSSEVDLPKTKRAGPGYSAHMKNMMEVDEILEKLKQKHAENYTPEQLLTWAHMIQMKKHESYDTAPNKPFFGSKSKKAASTPSEDGLSPLKKINMRSECIQQLNQWHQLKEKGAITSEQYEEMQATILCDIKKF